MYATSDVIDGRALDVIYFDAVLTETETPAVLCRYAAVLHHWMPTAQTTPLLDEDCVVQTV